MTPGGPSRPRPQPAGRDLAAGALLLLAYGAALALAAAGGRWGPVVALAAVVGGEVAVRRTRPSLVAALDLAGAGQVAREGARLLAVVALAGRTGSHPVLVATTVTAGLVLLLAAARTGTAAAVRHLRRPPLLSRNLDLGDLRLPSAPHRLLSDPGGVEAVVALVIAIGLAADDGNYGGWLEAALGVATALALLPPVWLTAHAARLRRSGVRQRMLDAVTAAVERLRPDVAVYFAATPEEVYQAEMWLEPVERLDRPAMVVLRDPAVLDRLGPTSLPVVCTPYNGTLAKLPLPPAVATLFPTHSGNNLAMMRRGEARTVFVGHGDSDKPDSVNPVARGYEEIWVAGPLGRRRYAEAAIGVRPDAIVEIGRPQIDVPALAPAAQTVLYAPTWEGWGDDPHHSSLPHVGPDLVRALLSWGDVRVLYRPHPLTGRRDPRLREADAEVRALLFEAGAVEVPYPRLGDHVSGDLLDAALATGRAPFARASEVDERAAVEAAFWTAGGPTDHRVLDPSGPRLASCFAQATHLVADVSSVVSEFLALDRPYGVVDTRGLGPAEFVRQFPSVAGGVVIAADLANVSELIEGDATAAARRRLRADAIGPPDAGAERFAAAVDRLVGLSDPPRAAGS